ncbi:MAG TPA: YkgJ family cysteine cluster protein [Acidobacteriota bacterium]
MDACACEKCVSACRRDPGRLIPGDVKKIAAFLKLSEKELLELHLVRIPAKGKNRHIHFLAPAKMKAARFLAAPGTVVPDYYEREDGRCVFLSPEGSCLIHEVKPFECAAYMGCRHTFLGRPYIEKDVEAFFASRWRKAQDQLR